MHKEGMHDDKEEGMHGDKEETYMKEEEEDADPVDDAMAADPEPEMDMPDDDMDMDMGGDIMAGVPEESREAVGKAVMQAVADSLGLDVDISGGDEDPMEEGEHADKEEMDHPMEEAARDDKEEGYMKEEEEIEEALDGVTTELTEEEVVQEVARRVAKRILRAKKAQKDLNEALGRK